MLVNLKEETQNWALFVFWGKAFALVVIWAVLSALLQNEIYLFNKLIIKFQSTIAIHLLNGLGHSANVVHGSGQYLSHVELNNNKVLIGEGCSGLELFLIFFAFLLLFKGPIKHKAWFVPFGFLIILTLNTIRIAVLSYLAGYYPSFLHFNHKYTFVLLIYGTIFLLWLWWNKRFAGTIIIQK